MGIKWISEMRAAAEDVERLESRLAGVESTCEDLSRIVACLVSLHGGDIPSDVWDRVQATAGFLDYGKQLTEGGIRISTLSWLRGEDLDIRLRDAAEEGKNLVTRSDCEGGHEIR